MKSLNEESGRRGEKQSVDILLALVPLGIQRSLDKGVLHAIASCWMVGPGGGSEVVRLELLFSNVSRRRSDV